MTFRQAIFFPISKDLCFDSEGYTIHKQHGCRGSNVNVRR